MKVRNTVGQNGGENMHYFDSFVACDIETTGFNPKKGSRIIEVGAVKVVGGVAHSAYSSLVGPKRYIPKEITDLTNISAEMLENQPDINIVMQQFLDFAGDLPLLFHNATFDMRFIRPACHEYLGLRINNIVLDTCRIAKKYKNCLPFYLGPDHDGKELAKKLNTMFASFEEQYARAVICTEPENNVKPDSCSLGNLTRLFGLKNVAAHTALSDAVASAKLYFMLWQCIRKMHPEA